jgi:hypothetical protein
MANDQVQFNSNHCISGVYSMKTNFLFTIDTIPHRKIIASRQHPTDFLLSTEPKQDCNPKIPAANVGRFDGW